MRKTEQRLWDSFKRNAPKSLDLQRVENLVGEGMPDVYVGGSGKWVELKAPPKIPARANTPLLGEKYGALTSQKNWHLKNEHLRNGTSFFLIRTPEPDKRLFLLPGGFGPVINVMSLKSISEQSIASTWEEIMEVIK